MMNIFVTYRCNLDCPYCFARQLRDEFPGDMDKETFERLLGWMAQANVPSVAFIGGEPTLHPRLPEMLEQTAMAGISPVLFTNGLFPEGLASRLAPHVANVVVNYNEPQTYGAGQWERLHANLDALAALRVRLTFSKNFSRQTPRYDYLLQGAERYAVRAIRYDISRPAADCANTYVSLDETREIMASLVHFVKECEAMGVRTGLDCSVRFCDVRNEDRQYLERVSAKFTGICHPSIDIHPNLSASYCLPLHGVRVPDVTRFADQDALRWHFAQMVRPMRLENVSASCLDCKDFMRRCQGGCLALRRAAPCDTERCAIELPEAVTHE